MNQINAIRMICNYFNCFKKASGSTENIIDIDNIIIENGKIKFDNSQDDDWTPNINFESILIELPFTFDMCATNDEIKQAIEKLQEQVLNHKNRHWTSLYWLVDKDGKQRQWKDIRRNLGYSLKAYKTGKPYTIIVSTLKLADSHDDKQWKNAENNPVYSGEHDVTCRPFT